MFRLTSFVRAKPKNPPKGAGETKRNKYNAVIGLEVHAQLIANTKLFSSSPATVLAPPNSLVSPMDFAAPGALPVLNQRAVEQGLKTGMALNGKINTESFFDRKHYFYHDLPTGYQITQQRLPLMTDGSIQLVLPTYTKRVRVSHLKLEQDSGKSIHNAHPNLTYIDLNRAGVGLMEIVSEPDMSTAQEAAAYLRKLSGLLRYIGTCTGSMEEGSLRCDVNVSLHRPGEPWGTRVEVKNVNKIKAVVRAIEFEIARQSAMLDAGQRVPLETRYFDAANGSTVFMRSKETETDYRYMPEPDLPPLRVPAHLLQSAQRSLPELPDAMRMRFQQQYGLSEYDASTIIEQDGAALFYESAAKGSSNVKRLANWLTSEVFGHLNEQKTDMRTVSLSPAQLRSLVELVEASKINGLTGKEVLALMLGGDSRSADAIVKEKGFEQISGELEALCNKILQSHPKERDEFLKGKTALMGFFVGQAMRASQNRADPKSLGAIFARLLGK